MYRNVKAEMTRLGITIEELSKELGCTVSTMCNKLNGKTPISVKEAKKIKTFLGVDIPLEILFEEVG